MGDADLRTLQLACYPFNVGQNDKCLQIVVYAYSIRLRFGRARGKFLGVACDCISPIEHHPCNGDELVSDCCCLWSVCTFCDGGDELVELVVVL